jgi:hypothetical protein
METRGDGRREFLGSLGAGGLATALLLAGRNAGADDPKGDRGGEGRLFTGTGRDQNLFQAMENAFLAAIDTAAKELGASPVTWTIEEIVTVSTLPEVSHAATATIRARAALKDQDGRRK